MRAMTCPQCGSLITHLTPQQSIADCDYCGARLVSSEQFSMNRMFAAEAARFRAPAPYVRPREPIQPMLIAISGVGIFTFLLIVIAFLSK